MMREQWFLRCDEINDHILDALRSGKLSITPNFLRTKLEDWLSNKEPWCLSRQLVWGHRIPAYRLANDGEWITATSKLDAQRILGLGSRKDVEILQDDDVLDTWFSSSLVPLVIQGWPQRRVEAVPLSLMETGHDIIGFWVARMLTVCQRLTGYLPFTHILLHGLVRDSTGRKMSKSLGNVIDPNDVIDGISIDAMIDRLNESALSESEKKLASADLRMMYPSGIRECGPDALRFALLRHDLTALDVSINISETAVEGLRFCNKLWNLCSYAKGLWSKAKSAPETRMSVHPADRWIRSCLGGALRSVRMHIDDGSVHLAFSALHKFILAELCDVYLDRWIRSCLGGALRSVRMHIDDGSVHLAFSALHKFILAELCDVYLETTKKALWSGDEKRINEIALVLHEVIERSLVVLSVFMPFVSEHLFDDIKTNRQLSIYDHLLSENELSNAMDSELEIAMSIGLAVVSTIRSLRHEFELPTKLPLNISVCSDGPSLSDVESVICDLGNISINSYNRFGSLLENTSLPVPVPGHPVILGVQLDGEYSELLHKRITSQLEKAEQRKMQFEAKAHKYEKLCDYEGIKQSLLEKNRRKAAQARSVALGMTEEITKLKDLLQRVEQTRKYDHHSFPGVVPRTFTGPIVLSVLLFPLVKVMQWWDMPKYWSLFAARTVLGMGVLLSFCNFARCIEKHFGRHTADFLRLITVTQFHFLFYASRPLPNTFALIGGVTVPIDSLLWRRWLWPEGEVWWFNVVLNRSNEYGVRFAICFMILRLLRYSRFTCCNKCLALSGI
ncbi:putative valine--tRNA ligase, cytoplasmic [Toxocara canis]|uniref:valine--tRNA ligase n=1 Tax=Toxocara canis TaxID=6265 RepID=A0A0B2VUL3_TOXCA|nr:putative valine--tRNA ligase, cytoplasmic [Toxocara canis]